MLATVTLYKNTGFNKDNIPDGPGVLPTGTQMNNHVFLQKKGLGYFDLEGEYSDVQNVDYVKIDNEFYFVTSFEMLNENCARMFLEVDAVTTIGISNMAFTGGWTERQCPSSNTMFSNTVDEPFVPTQDQVVEDGGYIGLTPNSQSTDYSFVGATVDLENINYEAKSYLDTTAATQDSVLVPQLPYPADKTEFSTQIPDSSYSELPAICFYNLDNQDIKANIAAVRSLGIENSISYAYQVPAGYCNPLLSLNKKYTSVTGTTGLNTATNIRFAYGSYTPKEKKAYSGQFHKIQLVATLSNEKSQFYKPEDIRESNETNPIFRWYTDPQPVGTVYFRPKCYKGNTDNQLIESVKGISQRTVPIGYKEQSGQFIKDYERRVEATNDAVKRMTGSVSGALSGMEQGAVGGNVGLVAGLVAGAGAGFISGQAQMGKNRYLYEYDRNIVAPEVTFTRSEGLQSYLPNNGYVQGYHLSDIDLQRFDDFLIRYGWADFKKFEITDMFTRPHFNYIKCRDINFNAPQPMQMRNIAKTQLEEGVRIQHEIPNNAAYNSNT